MKKPLKIGLMCLALSYAASASSAFAQGMGHGGWHVSQYIDKLTDKKVSRGARQYNVPNYFVHVEVLCSGRNLSYSFVTYNSDETAVPIRQEYNLLAGTAAKKATIRLDNEAAVSLGSSSSDYNNEFLIGESYSSDIDVLGATQIALARRVLMKIELQTGSAFIELDQTDPRLKFVLAQCVKASDLGARQKFWAERRLREQQAAKREAQQKARQEAERAAAAAAEQAENDKYNVALAGLDFHSTGRCSFIAVRSDDRKCEFWFPTEQPGAGDRFVIIMLPPALDSFGTVTIGVKLFGDTAYVVGDGRRYGPLKWDGGCWIGQNPVFEKLCIRPGKPKFEPGQLGI